MWFRMLSLNSSVIISKRSSLKHEMLTLVEEVQLLLALEGLLIMLQLLPEKSKP